MYEILSLILIVGTLFFIAWLVGTIRDIYRKVIGIEEKLDNIENILKR